MCKPPRGEREEEDVEATWAAAWQMVVEAELKRGKKLSELRLDKSVERIIRRKKY